MDRAAVFYSAPSYYHYGAGGAMPVFSGSRRQRGGSIFGALKSFFAPILGGIGRKVMKRGAQEAVGLAKDVVKDAFMFKNVNDSVIRNGKKRALDLTRYAADEGLNSLEQMIGSGKRRRKTQRRTAQRRTTQRRRTQPRKNLRKRKSRPKKTKSRPKKRRRTVKSLF